MDNKLQNQTPDPSTSQPEFEDRRSVRQSRLEQRRSARRERFGGSWVPGVILIGVGILILLQSLNLLTLDNWWALFILIPASVAFGAAWKSYKDAGGRLTAAARGFLVAGLVISIVAAIFLFGLEWTILGPVILIIVGLGLLVNTLLPG